MEVAKNRKEGIELLRIIAMLCIIGGHFILFTGFSKGVEKFSINYFLLWTLYAINLVGTNVYVLISGYFWCSSSFSWKKVGRLWGGCFSIHLVFR